MRQTAIRPYTFSKTASPIALRASSRAAFSTSASRRQAEAETDDELSAKLESEIQAEEDINTQQPSSVKDFLDNSLFKLVDIPGQEQVKLTRDFGEEK